MECRRISRREYRDLHRRYYATSVVGVVSCASCGSTLGDDILLEESTGLVTYCPACTGL